MTHKGATTDKGVNYQQCTHEEGEAAVTLESGGFEDREHLRVRQTLVQSDGDSTL